MTGGWRRVGAGAMFSAVVAMPLVGLPLLRGEAVGGAARWLVPLVGVVVGFLAWPVWQAGAQRAAATSIRTRLSKIAGALAIGLALALGMNVVIQGGLDAWDLVSAGLIFATIFVFAALTPRIAGGGRS